jgi:hypothetical protein
MASYKDYKSISAAKKAGSIYYTNKAGKKMLAVTKEDLNAWKKKNKGKYKGSALTAWANAKGKDIKPSTLKKSPFPKTRPSSGSVKVEVLIGSKPKSDVEDKIEKGKNPMKFKDAAKKKKATANKKGKPMNLSGNSKGGMAKRKAKK